MGIPASLRQQGFVDPNTARLGGRKHRRLMIGTDGPSNSGKTEFALSAPGPGIVLAVDRQFDAVFDNPNPPEARRDDFAFKVIQAPLPTQAVQNTYVEHWRNFYAAFKLALSLPEVRTVVVDGDSDTWELQRLAEFGQLQQIPSIRYAGVNAARRAMYATAWDSGKIIICTNKISKEYKAKIDPATGLPLMKDGKEVRDWDGKSYERQGFSDQDYLFSLQVRHLFRQTTNGPEWGLMILKCKADPTVNGMELWGEDCNFAGLVQTCYPQIPLSEWGF